MATIAIHGRSATSFNTGVDHSHPRHTELGPLMHNGVVRPILENPFQLPQEGLPDTWIEKYALDTDYLAELANRGLLDVANLYLNGYAAILLVQKDGVLVVQNQGANLYMNVKHGEVEFGTTMELCPGGSKFESTRAEAYEGTVWCRPIEDLNGRTVLREKYAHITSKDTGEKKAQIPIQKTFGKDGRNIQKDLGSIDQEQRRKNKKGRKYLTLMTNKISGKKDGAKDTVSTIHTGIYKKNPVMITVDGKLIDLDTYLSELGGPNRLDERKVLESLRESQKDLHAQVG